MASSLGPARRAVRIIRSRIRPGNEVTRSPRPCTICGGDLFQPGSGGRKSLTGLPPCCVTCLSLERHRAVREAFRDLPLRCLDTRRVLHLAPDPSIDPAWFRTFEGSVYGGKNSIDLHDIPRPAGAYDLVFLSNVLEHVRDDHRCFAEILRVLSPTGVFVAILSVPFSRPATVEYASAEPPYFQYRVYGSDMPARWLAQASAEIHHATVRAEDPVTGVPEHLFVFARVRSALDALTPYWKARLVPAGAP